MRLAEDGEMAVLVIEQNIGVACAVSENVAIMVNGRINRVIEAPRLAADRALQQRLLGVGRHGHDDTPIADTAAPEGTAAPARPARASVARLSSRTRRSRRAGRSRCRSPGSRRRRAPATPSVVALDAAASRRAEIRPLAASGQPVVIVAGTLDTKGEELRFIRDLLEAERRAHAPGRSLDLGQAFGRRRRRRSRSRSIIRAARPACSAATAAPRSPRWRRPSRPGSARQSGIAGMISAGGSGATSLVTPAMRRLPVGVPKIMISTVASGDVGRYVGAGRHHDDVFGHRRAGHQRDLAPDPRERRAGDGRHGQGAARGDARGARIARARRPSCPRSG